MDRLDARKNAAVRRLKHSNNAWGKLVAKYEAEMFASLPAEHAARAKPSERLIKYHATRDGQVVAGLVADILGVLGCESTLRVLNAESGVNKPMSRDALERTLRLEGSEGPLLAGVLTRSDTGGGRRGRADEGRERSRTRDRTPEVTKREPPELIVAAVGVLEEKDTNRPERATEETAAKRTESTSPSTGAGPFTNLGGMERAPEGSFELENSDGDEVVDAIEESVDDLEVSVVSVEVDGRVSGSVKSGGGSSMRGNFSVDYEDVGMGSTPPTSAAGDDAAFDVERGGVSLDDEDFEVDHGDVW